jgi:hypothetical protein
MNSKEFYFWFRVGTIAYEIKHPSAPESMIVETGMPISSASMTRSELRGVKVKVVRSI